MSETREANDQSKEVGASYQAQEHADRQEMVVMVSGNYRVCVCVCVFNSASARGSSGRLKAASSARGYAVDALVERCVRTSRRHPRNPDKTLKWPSTRQDKPLTLHKLCCPRPGRKMRQDKSSTSSQVGKASGQTIGTQNIKMAVCSSQYSSS